MLQRTLVKFCKDTEIPKEEVCETQKHTKSLTKIQKNFANPPKTRKMCEQTESNKADTLKQQKLVDGSW